MPRRQRLRVHSVCTQQLRSQGEVGRGADSRLGICKVGCTDDSASLPHAGPSASLQACIPPRALSRLPATAATAGWPWDRSGAISRRVLSPRPRQRRRPAQLRHTDDTIETQRAAVQRPSACVPCKQQAAIPSRPHRPVTKRRPLCAPAETRRKNNSPRSPACSRLPLRVTAALSRVPALCKASIPNPRRPSPHPHASRPSIDSADTPQPPKPHPLPSP
jgi:hypothetical protein